VIIHSISRVPDGPTCSSLVGLFTAIGPFFPNPDGHTLFENVYAWNKLGNILFLDSPLNAGYSYRDPNADPVDGDFDDNVSTSGAGDLGRPLGTGLVQVASKGAEAVQMFLDRFPEYNGRAFYIFGEAYAGVYVPTLTQKIIQLVQGNVGIGEWDLKDACTILNIK